MTVSRHSWGNGAALYDADLCRAAITAGADVNDIHAGAEGPPLVVATSQRLGAVVKILLAHGAQPDLVGPTCSSALQEAINDGHIEICKTLLSAAADPNLIDQYGDTPLMRAADQGWLDIVTLLVERGADINAYSATTKRFTALHYAAIGEDAETCQRLLELGADPMSRSDDAPYGALSPFMFAVKRGYDRLVRLMFDSGRVDPFFVSPSGATAAKLAATFKSTQELVRCLEQEFRAKATQEIVNGAATPLADGDDRVARRGNPSMGML
jgi:hypothetical protein